MSDCSLYLISPSRLEIDDFAPRLKEALSAEGVKAFQLRLKEASDEQILEAAQKLLPICRAHDTAFILNDRADLTKAAGADGVHLGQEDMSILEARTILGAEPIIGLSCHASRDMAIDGAEAGADYVAFGAFYPTQSKPREKVEKWGMPKPGILDWWSTNTTVPCVAIGGITPANCAPLVAAGADFIAAITYVWSHGQGPKAAVEEFERAIKQAKS